MWKIIIKNKRNLMGKSVLKQIKRIIVSGVSLVLAIVALTIYICIVKYPGEIERIKDSTGIEIPKNSIVLLEEDTHGGFMGDGHYYKEIQLTDEGVEKFIEDVKDADTWGDFPLSDEVNYWIYRITNKKISKIITEGYYNRDNDKPIEEREEFLFLNEKFDPEKHKERETKYIPYDIKNGMYFIKDRQEDQEENMLIRCSFNFTIAILDLDRNKVYIYELDT